MEPKAIVVQPYIQPGTPPQAGIRLDFVLATEADLQSFSTFFRNPHCIVTLIVRYGVNELILQGQPIIQVPDDDRPPTIRELLEPL